MPVLNIYAMKAFRLNRKEVIAIICCISVAIGAVSAIPEKYRAYDGREYIIETEYKYNWFEAFNECTRRDGQLVIIDSKQKNNVIVYLLKDIIGVSRNLWLGGNDQFSTSLDKDRPFVWSATGKHFTYTFWADSEPNNMKSQEHCVHIYKESRFKWNDNDCNVKMGFICEHNSDLETYNKQLKLESDDEKMHKNDVFLKELNTRLQNLEQVANDQKLEYQKLQNSIEFALQKLTDQQELTEKSWWKKLQEQVNELSRQVKQSFS